MTRRLLIALALCTSPAAFAQDLAAGAAKAKQVCAACHGDDGNGTANFPDYPKLAGQHADYLLKAMRDYKSGARKNAIMAPMMQPLSVNEMRDLAAFFASQSGTLQVKR
jgi:cytochrome c553